MQKNPAVLSSRLAQLFPRECVVTESTTAAGAELLYREEIAIIGTFGEKRVADFVAGRLCARRALSELGIQDFPLTIDSGRTPRWPDGVVGSISHTDGLCVAVVARADTIPAVGIDVEHVTRVTEDLWPQLFTSVEREALDALPEDRRGAVSCAGFAAKEAFYKCQFPVTRAWLDFTDVEIRFASDEPTFTVSAVDGAASEIALRARGGYRAVDAFIVAGVWFES